MEKLLNSEFSIKTNRYGKIVLMNHEDVDSKILSLDSFYFEPNPPSVDLRDYLGKTGYSKRYRIRAFVENEGILEPLTKFTFFNFPDNIEESVRDHFLYLSTVAKKYQRSEISSFAARLTRFLLWCNTGHKYPYVYLEVGNGPLGFNICNKTGDELLFNSDMILQNTTFAARYENFCNTGKTYAIITIPNPLKSVSCFLIEGFITKEEFEQLKNYDEQINGKENQDA